MIDRDRACFGVDGSHSAFGGRALGFRTIFHAVTHARHGAVVHCHAFVLSHFCIAIARCQHQWGNQEG